METVSLSTIEHREKEMGLPEASERRLRHDIVVAR
jgi:hypothetical protein